MHILLVGQLVHITYMFQKLDDCNQQSLPSSCCVMCSMSILVASTKNPSLGLEGCIFAAEMLCLMNMTCCIQVIIISLIPKQFVVKMTVKLLKPHRSEGLLKERLRRGTVKIDNQDAKGNDMADSAQMRKGPNCCTSNLEISKNVCIFDHIHRSSKKKFNSRVYSQSYPRVHFQHFNSQQGTRLSSNSLLAICTVTLSKPIGSTFMLMQSNQHSQVLQPFKCKAQGTLPSTIVVCSSSSFAGHGHAFLAS